MKRTNRMIKALPWGVVLFLVFALVGQAAAQSWSTKAPMPTARNGLSLGAHNATIYAAGGWNGFHRTALEAYDTGTDTWTPKASMPGPQSHAASGVINGVLYLAGGTNCCVEINTFTAYDILTNSWAFKPSMPTTRQGAAGGVINGKLYVAGGINSQNVSPVPALATLEAFDPITNAWSSLAPMPTARWFPAAGVVNGVLYVAGGITSTNFPPLTITTTVEAFDPATNTWTAKATMPTARWGHTVAAVDGILYVIGGLDINGASLSTVEAYNPVTNTWTTETSMPTARSFFRAASVAGTLYAIGGEGVAGTLSTNEAFTPATIVPFAAFTPKVEITLGPLANDDAFEVKGAFTLGAGSDGIVPLTEAVKLQVGTFSTTIPAGSFVFVPAKPGKPAHFKFEGVIGGVALQAKITPLGGSNFGFKAEGTGANLTGTVNPVTVQLTIGNDGGSATVTAEFE